MEKYLQNTVDNVIGTQEITIDLLEKMIEQLLPKNIFEKLDINSFAFANSLTPKFPLNLKKCKIGESKIDNYGVFATKNIKEKEIVTLYPADVVLLYPNGRGEKGEIRKYGVVNSTFTPSHLKVQNKEDVRKLFPYDYEIHEKYSILGNPKIIEDSSYLGHMINDGATNIRNEKEYRKTSEKNMNVLAYPICGNKYIVIIAIKEIKEKEELFLSYGFKYWKDR